MNKKMIIGLVIAAGVLLVGIIVLLVVAQRSAPDNNTTTNTGNSTITANSSVSDSTTVTTDTVTNTDSITSNTTITVDNKAQLYQVARFFTERYGSYSTDNEHENIDNLRPFMTEAMQATADVLVATQTNMNTYYGITTQTANVKMIDYTPTATGATVEVITRRVETTAGTTKTYTQTARLQLKKINDAWKIDTFKWQKL